jgi:hypothetical protein
MQGPFVMIFGHLGLGYDTTPCTLYPILEDYIDDHLLAQPPLFLPERDF